MTILPVSNLHIPVFLSYYLSFFYTPSTQSNLRTYISPAIPGPPTKALYSCSKPVPVHKSPYTDGQFSVCCPSYLLLVNACFQKPLFQEKQFSRSGNIRRWKISYYFIRWTYLELSLLLSLPLLPDLLSIPSIACCHFRFPASPLVCEFAISPKASVLSPTCQGFC